MTRLLANLLSSSYPFNPVLVIEAMTSREQAFGTPEQETSWSARALLAFSFNLDL